MLATHIPSEELVLRTKLTPPRPHRQVLPRPALHAQLREALDYRLTIVQAGPGYGKTTALASLDTGDILVFWYSVEEADADPPRFLAYLIAAFRTRLPTLSDLPLAVLQERGSEGNFAVWMQVLDALINALTEALPGPALLILDDYHFVAGSPAISALVERLITYLPPHLHVILVTRQPLSSTRLARWRTHGEVLEIDDTVLAFRPAEIASLFCTTYGMRLSPPELAALADKTDGWPIALQMIWQDLRNATVQNATDLLTRSPASRGPDALEGLFEYLACEVLAGQPPEIAAFLCATAVLRTLTPAACDAVIDGEPCQGVGSAAMLERLHQLDLFVVALGEGHYRYHHLFHDFLRRQAEADPAGTQERHRRAARFYEAQQDDEAAIYHWLAAREFAAAALAIERAGEAALYAGRLETVAAWVDAIPAAVLAAHPCLHVYRGEVFRLRTAFDQALACYARAEQIWRARNDQAGISRALRGRASVYLDTVQPAQAERLLEEALCLIDGITDREARARLLELQAENALNLGDPARAEQLRATAQALREEGPGEDIVSVRVKFRTGRLEEARRILEDWIEAERTTAARAPRAHRETLLLLSVTYAFLGLAEQAVAAAQEGIALGERLHSPFITAVAYTRLGHALQLRRSQSWPPDPARAYDEAIRCFQAALALGDRLAVRRTRVEALWGLTRAYGFAGDLEAAQRAASEAVAMAREDGDAWLAAMIELMLGASSVLAGQAQAALPILSRTLITLRECGDSFGRAATRLWLSLAYHTLQQPERFAACVDDLLALCEAHGYAFLFTAPSMLAPPDSRCLIPMLLAARARAIRPGYVARLLHALGVPAAPVHPGYQLRVQTLGAFRVWRGTVEVAPRAWQRDKARQLFQLLLTRRGRWLQREEIVECLWPDLAPEVAGRDFKVALNVVNKVLEPTRSHDAPCAFIAREGTAYRLRPEADLWLDAAAFEQACTAGLRLFDRGAIEAAIAQLQAALQLYGGDYLPDALYEDWASAERERLLSLFLRAADVLAEALLQRGQYNETVDICQRILAHDPCWERAYALTMLAYARQGNRPQALRVYQRCIRALREELGIDPAPATTALYQRIVRGEDVSVTSV
jgi:ATP/maltotriose-dependent transcriptional regulator MalT/DNA-binding SARP family transcriptional activator